MFGWMNPNPEKKLRGEYARKMKEAMLLQRSGKMAAFASKSAEAEAINQQLKQLKASQHE